MNKTSIALQIVSADLRIGGIVSCNIRDYRGDCAAVMLYDAAWCCGAG